MHVAQTIFSFGLIEANDIVYQNLYHFMSFFLFGHSFILATQMWIGSMKKMAHQPKRPTNSWFNVANFCWSEKNSIRTNRTKNKKIFSIWKQIQPTVWSAEPFFPFILVNITFTRTTNCILYGFLCPGKGKRNAKEKHKTINYWLKTSDERRKNKRTTPITHIAKFRMKWSEERAGESAKG